MQGQYLSSPSVGRSADTQGSRSCLSPHPAWKGQGGAAAFWDGLGELPGQNGHEERGLEQNRQDGMRAEGISISR